MAQSITPFRVAGLLALCAGALLFSSAPAAELTPADKVIDGFVESVQQNDAVTDEQRQQVLQLVGALKQDEDFREAAITEALRELYPQFSAALEALGSEKTQPAVEALEQLAGTEDPYLAAESTFFLSRAYLMEERFEEALPLLKKLSADLSDKTLHTGEALFLKGVSESRLLLRKEAIASLEQFLKEYPNSPERMRVGAWRHKELLQLIEDGSIGDVQEHMDYSRRRLALQYSGAQTQGVQDRIIEMLDKLIKEAEEKECNCQGGGSGEGQQEGQGNGQGNGQGGNVGGQGQSSAQARRRVLNGGERTPWGDLQKKARNPETFAALKDKFPARYRQLIEQYYRSFQEGAQDE